MEQEIQAQTSEKDDKKVHAENMRLKKYIYALEREIEALKKFVGGK